MDQQAIIIYATLDTSFLLEYHAQLSLLFAHLANSPAAAGVNFVVPYVVVQELDGLSKVCPGHSKAALIRTEELLPGESETGLAGLEQHPSRPQSQAEENPQHTDPVRVQPPKEPGFIRRRRMSHSISISF